MNKRVRRANRSPTQETERRSLDRGFFKITVRGYLDSSWSEWFDGLAITADPVRGETVLSGLVPDQAALHGLLNKLWNLALPLIGLTCLGDVEIIAQRGAGQRTDES